ncbi:MAG: hypothetical protein HQL59_02345 [Magnetococcales bacterium]|nr:hypothetical protein [Magnetococcales bacterium]
MTRRLETTGTLVEKSSGAKKIADSGKPDALAMRDKARSFHQAAAAALKKGNTDEASTLLNQANQSFFEGVRLADGGATKGEKAAVDFNRRLESVKVLLEAHQRISKEKGQGSGGSDNIRSLMDQANALASAQKMDAARGKLDEAYVTAKLGIEQMRRGDTLVRSLHFANKQEEYDYELDRNNTHQMLVTMLLQGKPESVQKMANDFVVQAKALRAKAEQEASGGNYEQAVRTLEESTAGLVKAIRGAGVYIPG